MKIYISKKYSPYFNLPMEELLLKDENNKEDIIFIYQHENAVIIGRNQNAYEEVKLDVLKSQNIELYRRISGGGAVYHDLGNINFSFITKNEERNYEKFLAPIVEFLKTLNLEAEFKGRNDLLVNGAKVSGNAQFIYKDRMFHHGTILFDANLAKLSEVLNPSKLKMESKGIKSARQRVTNILNELKEKITEKEFIDRLVNFLIEKYNAKLEELPIDRFANEINELANQRKNEEWLLGKNPEFSISNEAKTSAGILKVKLNVVANKIQEIAFEGDFLSKKLVDDIYHNFIDADFDRATIAQILESLDTESYLGSIPKNEILDLIMGI